MSGFLVFLLVHIQPVILTLLYLSKVKAIRQGQAEASHYPRVHDLAGHEQFRHKGDCARENEFMFQTHFVFTSR